MAEFIYVGGVGHRFVRLPRASARDGLFGYWKRYPATLAWIPGCEERLVRGQFHELLHAIDDIYRVNLSHDQVRAIAAGLASAFGDSRNAPANLPCRPTCLRSDYEHG